MLDLSLRAPPTLDVADGATSPNPGAPGAQAWSSTTQTLVRWNGERWSRTAPTIASGRIIPIATYGDSRADLGHENLFDLRTIGNEPLSGVTQYQMSATTSMVTLSYTPARLVGNGGISGDTLAQMIARETAAASATRKSLADLASTGAKVLFVRASINSITSLVTGAFVQATADAIIADREDLIRRAVALGFIVVDEGEWGYDFVGDPTGFPQSRIDGIRQTIAAVNTAAAAVAAASGGRVIHLPFIKLVADSAGQWLAGMSGDTANPGQRVHLSNKSAVLLAQAEAGVLTSLYGAPVPGYTQFEAAQYANAVPNADLSASAAGVGTGWAVTNLGGTGGGQTAAIITIDGKRWQEGRFTWTGAGANRARVSIPIPPIVGGGAAVPVIAGELWGFEADVIIDDGNGGAPPGVTVSDFDQEARLFFQSSGGANGHVHDLLQTRQADVQFGQAVKGRLCWGQVVMPADSATLSALLWDINVSTTQAVTGGAVLRVAVSQPRAVRLPRAPLVHVGLVAPAAPRLGDLWIDTN